METNLAREVGNGVRTPSLVFSQPGCKICASEHRLRIDEMLRSGRSQADVRRYFNGVLGEEHFTANNLSVHARKHVYGDGLDELVRKLARAKRYVEVPVAFEAAATPQEALQAVLQVGLDLISAGATVPEPGDVIRAAKEIDRIQREGQVETEAEMLRDMKAFTDAVKSKVPKEQWDEIFAEFERNLEKTRR